MLMKSTLSVCLSPDVETTEIFVLSFFPSYFSPFIGMNLSRQNDIFSIPLSLSFSPIHSCPNIFKQTKEE